LRFGWLTVSDIRLWLSAVDCTLFNYLEILTSGAATLARSWGTPVLIPVRLDTVDLDEPSPLVFRFSEFGTDFAEKLEIASRTKHGFVDASPWREKTSWSCIAKKTVEAYAFALGQ
jgi:hypothetical protein